MYIVLPQIFSGNYLPNFVRIAIFFLENITENIWSLFLETVYYLIMFMCQQ